MRDIGNLYILSSPSGGGKSSLIMSLISSVPDLKVSISYTTRPIGVGEIDGLHYNFISHEIFQHLLEKNDFLEFTQIFEHYYGTSRCLVEKYINSGVDVLLALDWQGANKIQKIYKNTILIYLLPPSKKILKERLVNRGRESMDSINKRMRHFFEQMKHFLEYDYIVINDDFDKALIDLKHIIYANRLTGLRQNRKNSQLIKSLLADCN